MLKELIRQLSSTVDDLEKNYAVEDRRLVEIKGFGWAVIGPGQHIRAATAAEIAKSTIISPAQRIDRTFAEEITRLNVHITGANAVTNL